MKIKIIMILICFPILLSGEGGYQIIEDNPQEITLSLGMKVKMEVNPDKEIFDLDFDLPLMLDSSFIINHYFSCALMIEKSLVPLFDSILLSPSPPKPFFFTPSFAFHLSDKTYYHTTRVVLGSVYKYSKHNADYYDVYYANIPLQRRSLFLLKGGKKVAIGENELPGSMNQPYYLGLSWINLQKAQVNSDEFGLIKLLRYSSYGFDFIYQPFEDLNFSDSLGIKGYGMFTSESLFSRFKISIGLELMFIPMMIPDPERGLFEEEVLIPGKRFYTQLFMAFPLGFNLK